VAVVWCKWASVLGRFCHSARTPAPRVGNPLLCIADERAQPREVAGEVVWGRKPGIVIDATLHGCGPNTY